MYYGSSAVRVGPVARGVERDARMLMSHDSAALNDFARTSEARPGAGQAPGTRILWRRRGVQRVRARTDLANPVGFPTCEDSGTAAADRGRV